MWGFEGDFWNKLGLFDYFFPNYHWKTKTSREARTGCWQHMWGQGRQTPAETDPSLCHLRQLWPLHKSKLRTLLLTPPGLKEKHCHKGLKLKKLKKGFLHVASGYGPTDGYRNTLVKCEALFQLHKKEQVTIFSVLGKAKLLRAHTCWSGHKGHRQKCNI